LAYCWPFPELSPGQTAQPSFSSCRLLTNQTCQRCMVWPVHTGCSHLEILRCIAVCNVPLAARQPRGGHIACPRSVHQASPHAHPGAHFSPRSRFRSSALRTATDSMSPCGAGASGASAATALGA
jgi:hypothetical protein